MGELKEISWQGEDESCYYKGKEFRVVTKSMDTAKIVDWMYGLVAIANLGIIVGSLMLKKGTPILLFFLAASVGFGYLAVELGSRIRNTKKLYQEVIATTHGESESLLALDNMPGGIKTNFLRYLRDTKKAKQHKKNNKK